ncbi:hypothetical protein HDV00_011642 [Rhizophlyctis rosea]|nr:hypothetical protein HDV00_011642 [Rhizophlyctis rosea]
MDRPSNLSLTTEPLYGSKQMAGNTFFVESLKDNSGGGMKHDDHLGLPHRTPVPSVYRRARAETFSSFQSPSKLMPEESGMHSSAGRTRSGSLSLPSNNIQSAFGPSLFASSWTPTSNGDGSTVDRGVRQATPPDFSVVAPGEDETTAVARTVEYLGLDDPLESNRQYHHQQYQQYNRTTHGLTAAYANANRARAYSVAVGEPSTLSISIPNSSTYRPRATSIAYLESAEGDVQAMRRGYRGDLDSPISDHSPDRGLHLHQPYDRTSPKDYIYSLDPDFDSGPPPMHDHQIPTRSLWIGNIDPALSPSDLLTLFAPFGPIESLRILPDKECAFVNYVRVEDAVRAKEEMQGGRVGNCIVRVGYGKAEAINDTQGMQPTKSLCKCFVVGLG